MKRSKHSNKIFIRNDSFNRRILNYSFIMCKVFSRKNYYFLKQDFVIVLANYPKMTNHETKRKFPKIKVAVVQAAPILFTVKPASRKLPPDSRSRRARRKAGSFSPRRSSPLTRADSPSARWVGSRKRSRAAHLAELLGRTRWIFPAWLPKHWQKPLLRQMCT